MSPFPRIYDSDPLDSSNLVAMINAAVIRSRTGFNAWNNFYIKRFLQNGISLKDILCLADSDMPHVAFGMHPIAPFLAQFFPTARVVQSDITPTINTDFDQNRLWDTSPLNYLYWGVNAQKLSALKSSETLETNFVLSEKKRNLFDLMICRQGICYCNPQNKPSYKICAGPHIRDLENFLNGIGRLLKPLSSSIAILHGACSGQLTVNDIGTESGVIDAIYEYSGDNIDQLFSILDSNPTFKITKKILRKLLKPGYGSAVVNYTLLAEIFIKLYERYSNLRFDASVQTTILNVTRFLNSQERIFKNELKIIKMFENLEVSSVNTGLWVCPGLTDIYDVWEDVVTQFNQNFPKYSAILCNSQSGNTFTFFVLIQRQENEIPRLQMPHEI